MMMTDVHEELVFRHITGQKVPLLKNEALLNQLEELAGKLGITVRYERMNVEDSSGAGGLCRMGGKYILLVHSRLNAREKIQVMAKALKGFDFSEIYLKPALRELLEHSKET